MQAQGVPWKEELGSHPLHSILNKNKNSGVVSKLYTFIITASHKPLPLQTVWKRDMGQSADLNWDTIWSNVRLSSRNSNHQFIHYKFIHRFYYTPRKLHQMKCRDNSFCGFCPDNITGTYMHMTWDCPEVNRFWWKVTGILSTLMDKTIPCSQPLLLLNDTSTIKLSINDRRILLAGLTAAKKLIVCRWKPPHLLSVKEWLRSYREIAQLELSTSRLRHVNSENILYWTNLLEKINCLI